MRSFMRRTPPTKFGLPRSSAREERLRKRMPLPTSGDDPGDQAERLEACRTAGAPREAAEVCGGSEEFADQLGYPWPGPRRQRHWSTTRRAAMRPSGRSVHGRSGPLARTTRARGRPDRRARPGPLRLAGLRHPPRGRGRGAAPGFRQSEAASP
jgi:hypothetical protein